ncbi:FecR family protein [Pedobacter nyackensis]|uniref:FecR family protein n=1 Tax=Pedobacter nyackensis TaxID=475255 RepID=UPI00292F6ABE|nr:FecR domain-containing protein [Pedobacter nyackensis]
MAKTLDKIRLQELAHKYLNGNLTKQEKDEFDLWFSQTTDKPIEISSLYAEEVEVHRQIILNRINSELDATSTKTITLWRGIAAAIFIIFSIAAGLWYFKSDQPAVIPTANVLKNDIAPGNRQATLTLANGKQILLNSKDKSVYKQIADERSEKLEFNTLTTAKGEQYQLILPDGSHVWLNSASSIKFPVSFAPSKERRVIVTGEAYFEVTKDKIKPFKVVSDGQLITVYGTRFNVNGYEDEVGTRTTLVEGSVDVNGIRLTPEHQAVNEKGEIKIIPVDIENIIAWKNGYFRFKSETLESIMRKVSRWYDVDVEFLSPALKDIKFGGVMTKYVNVSKVLEMLELTDEASFELKGRTIIIKNRK